MNRYSPRVSSTGFLISLPVLAFFVMAFTQIAFAIDPALEAYRKSYKASREMELGRAFLEEGRKEVQRGSYLRAISLLTNAINRGAGPEALELRSRAYIGMGSNELAITDLGALISARLNEPGPYLTRADAYISMGQPDKAMPDYDKALDIDPFNLEAHLSKGLANIALEKYESAISDFELALKIDPKNSDVLFNAAMTSFLAEMPQTARYYLGRAEESVTDRRYVELLRQKAAKAPEKTQYEESSGGLKGVLAQTAKLNSAPAIREQPTVTSNPTVKDSPFSGLPNIEAPNRPIKPKTLKEMLAMIGEEDFSGTWAGVYMGMNWNASFRFSGKSTSGILRIMTPSGKVETHYCKGVFEGNRVEASDQFGFRVSGRIGDDFRFVGQITTPDYKTVPVDIPLLQ